jgi:hypothetical protein
VLEDHFDHMLVVGNTELVRYSKKQRVGLGDGLVPRKLLNQHIRLRRIAAAEDRARVSFDEADLVLFLAATAEIGAAMSLTSAKMLRLTETRGSRA